MSSHTLSKCMRVVNRLAPSDQEQLLGRLQDLMDLDGMPAQLAQVRAAQDVLQELTSRRILGEALRLSSLRAGFAEISDAAHQAAADKALAAYSGLDVISSAPWVSDGDVYSRDLIIQDADGPATVRVWFSEIPDTDGRYVMQLENMDGTDIDEVRTSPQRDVTQTPAFKKWFGDSKVVDESGKPLVVYHGTTADFSQFRTPAYFAESAADATEFAEELGKGGVNVMPAYLRLQNPKILADFGDFAELTDEDAAGYMKLGYDGAILEPSPRGRLRGERRLLVVFKPEQIKSSIGNDGSFDPNSADITRSPERDKRLPSTNSAGQPIVPANDFQKLANFWRFMADSKVVDEQGRPVVVYRGQMNDANPGPVAYFSADPRHTEGYAGRRLKVGDDGRILQSQEDGGNVIPAYLSMKNPLVMTSDEYWYKGIKKGESAEKALLAKAKSSGHDGIIVRGFRDNAGPADMFITADSTQIKSAIGNDGSFDAGDADITRSTQRDQEKWQVIDDDLPSRESAELIIASWRKPNPRLSSWDSHELRVVDSDNKGFFAIEARRTDATQSPQRSSSSPGYNTDLPRGYVGEPSAQEERAADAVRDAEDAASEAWAEGKLATIKRLRAQLVPRMKEQGIELDDKGVSSLVQSLFHNERARTGDSGEEFAKYRELAAKVEPLRRHYLDLITDRIGPPEFDGMRQLADFQRPITDTKNFKSWFDGSKVVDKDGKPLIAFHGTNRDFSEFRTVLPGDKQLSNNNWMGELGSWFAAPSTSSEYDVGNAEVTAETFAELRAKDGEQVPEGAVIYPVFLAIKKPYETEGYDDITEQRAEAGGGKAFREKLIAEGYDGVVIRDSTTDGGQYRDDWIAFHPEQIKSALSATEFDANSADITKSPARWDGKRIERLMSQYAYVGDENRTKAYAGWVDPRDFLNATTPPENRERLEAEKRPLDPQRLTQETQEIRLDGEFTDDGDFKLDGHEGRHRMMAMRDSGITRVPVVFYVHEGHEARTRPSTYVRAQAWGKDLKAFKGFFSGTLTPISYAHLGDLKRQFGGDAVVNFSPQRPQFYSQLQRAIEGVPDRLATMAAPQWKLWLDANASKMGVKKDEIEWSGVKDWLAMQGKAKISKDDVAAFVRDNGVQVKDVVRGDLSHAENRHEYEYDADEGGWMLYDDGGEVIGKYNSEEEARAVALSRNSELAGGAKYQQYTLPGGENYREVLITLPVKNDSGASRVEFSSGMQLEDFLVDVSAIGLGDLEYGRIEDEDGDAVEFDGPIPSRVMDLVNQHGGKVVRGQEIAGTTFASNHWPHPNVLAHLRVDDRQDADGKRVLFVNEIQSDWGKDGRRKGFATKIDTSAWSAKEYMPGRFDVRDASGELVEPAIWADSADAAIAAAAKSVNAKQVPLAPFVTDTKAWVSLAIKRAIMLAVEGGHDRVALITGEQAADLYDLSHQLDSVVWIDQGDYEVEIIGKKSGSEVLNRYVARKDLSDAVGKELAEKIMTEIESGHIDGEFSGVDLKVGGEGMHAFYDTIVPQVANNILKKVGGWKVGEVALKPARLHISMIGQSFVVYDSETGTYYRGPKASQPWGERKSAKQYLSMDTARQAVDTLGAEMGQPGKQPGFDITDSMREQLKDGMPLFSTPRDPRSSFDFRQWFGKSKVVNEDGSPKVVYHGTSNPINFSNFDRSARGDSINAIGSWFSDSKDVANIYAGAADSVVDSGVEPHEGQRVMPVYLSIKNPATFETQDDLIDWWTNQVLADRSMRVGADAARAWLKDNQYDGLVMPASAMDPSIEDGSNYYLALNPTQIKSAIGNMGTFHPEASDVTLSTQRDDWQSGHESAEDGDDSEDRRWTPVGRPLERTGAPWEPIRQRPGEPEDAALSTLRSQSLPFGYQVSDLLSTNKKVSWWDKTVGTPYHLAQRFPKTFGRVYTAVQQSIADVSKYATRAADLAPTILPKLEHLSDIAKSPLSAADVHALSGPIFKGTVGYARDAAGKAVATDDVGSAGVVWTDDELRSMWKLDERQIALYREFRKATNKSISDQAITGMVRLAGDDGEGVRGRMLAATRVDEAASILGDHLADLAAKDPDRANTLQNTARQVKEIANSARGLMAKGYAPLQRFGKHTVYAPQIFTHGFFEMFESERDAKKRARELQDLFPGKEVTTGILSEENWRLFKGVTPESLELFGEALGLDQGSSEQESQVFQEYLRLAKSTRSALKHLIERKGVEGYSQDVGRVLAGFVYSGARLASQNLNAREVMQSVGAIPEREGDLRDHAIKFMEYSQNPSEEAPALRALLFTNYIGGSVASAATNLTQSLTTTLPTLAMHFGLSKAGAGMADALGIAKNGAGSDTDLAEALKRAELEGITAPQEVHHLMAQSQGKGQLKSGDGTVGGNAIAMAGNSVSKLALAWGKMFGWAELVNRKVAFAAAYKLAREKGDKNPYEFAKKIVADTQFTMNKGNNPQWARGPVGATLFTFKKFMVMYLEGLARMYTNGEPGSPERAAGQRAFALSLGIMFILAGAGGFPFADDLDDIIDGFAQRVLNKSFSSKLAKKEFFASIIGDAGADFVEGGVSAVAGFPIDFSGRLGMGNVVPGTGLLVKKQDYGRDITEIGGAAADFAKRLASGGAALAQGNVAQAAQNAAPTAVTNALKAADMWQMGYYRDAAGRKVSDTTQAEAILKGIGFQPQSVHRIQEATGIEQEMIALNKIREVEIANLWARGRIERNPELVDQAKQQLKDWNETNPFSPISIDPGQINKRVREANMTKAQRMVKTAPKELRAGVKAALSKETATEE